MKGMVEMKNILVRMVQKVYFNLSYTLGFADWDTNSPQPDLVRLQENGCIKGNSVLDIGCGSGDNAIYLAQKGYKVTGIDSSKSAISAAKKRVLASNVKVDLYVADALDLANLHRTFNAVIDYGLYHNFRGRDISRYVMSLSHVLQAGGQLVIECFNENAPEDRFGPRHVNRSEIESTFSDGWHVELIEAAAIQTRKGPIPAWLSIIKRL